MFWADRFAGEIETKYGKGKPVLIRDEKTPSGRVHVGSMRGVAIHGAISEVLTERGVSNVFKYEFNDMDPMDGFPEYLPEEFRQYMGKPLRNLEKVEAKATAAGIALPAWPASQPDPRLELNFRPWVMPDTALVQFGWEKPRPRSANPFESDMPTA